MVIQKRKSEDEKIEDGTSAYKQKKDVSICGRRNPLYLCISMSISKVPIASPCIETAKGNCTCSSNSIYSIWFDDDVISLYDINNDQIDYSMISLIDIYVFLF